MHWVMSLMIIIMLFIGYLMQSMPLPQKFVLYDFHKSVGILLLMFFIIRLFMRLRKKYPELPKDTPKAVKILAKMNVTFLYFAMLLMPLSGFLMSNLSGHSVPFFGIFQISSFVNNKPLAHTFYEMHVICGLCFIVLIVIHVIGGLFHHFILKDGVLRRMS